jgi:phage head maturation protease
MDSLITRAASFTASTFNREARTVEAVIATNSPVRRRDMRGEYDEIIDTAGMVLAERVPVLDTHNRDSINAVLGYATNVRVEAGGHVLATLNITDDKALELIDRGALTGVSVGFTVQEWSE